jgi:hypothetical protein
MIATSSTFFGRRRCYDEASIDLVILLAGDRRDYVSLRVETKHRVTGKIPLEQLLSEITGFNFEYVTDQDYSGAHSELTILKANEFSAVVALKLASPNLEFTYLRVVVHTLPFVIPSLVWMKVR